MIQLESRTKSKFLSLLNKKSNNFSAIKGPLRSSQLKCLWIFKTIQWDSILSVLCLATQLILMFCDQEKKNLFSLTRPTSTKFVTITMQADCSCQIILQKSYTVSWTGPLKKLIWILCYHRNFVVGRNKW